MKTKSLVIVFLLMSGITIYSCTSKSTSSVQTADTTSSAALPQGETKINWLSHTEKADNTLGRDGIQVGGVTIIMKNLAEACINDYQVAVSSGGGGSIIPTYSINFAQPDLQRWIDRAVGADSIVFKFGIYNQAFIYALNALHNAHKNDDQGNPFPLMNASSLNKTTIFLLAYDAAGNNFTERSTGKELPAYNLGNLHP